MVIELKCSECRNFIKSPVQFGSRQELNAARRIVTPSMLCPLCGRPTKVLKSQMRYRD